MEKLCNGICSLVLSAGKGTRMKSVFPKVLHKLLDEPMLWYVDQPYAKSFIDEIFFMCLGIWPI